MISTVNTASENTEIKVKHYPILPAYSRNNEIAILDGIETNNTYIQKTQPSNPKSGDVWITVNTLTTTPYPHIIIKSAIVQLGCLRQYINGSWVQSKNWYYYQNGWIRGRYYLVLGGQWLGELTLSTSSRFSYSQSSYYWFCKYEGGSQSGGSSGTVTTGYMSVTGFKQMRVNYIALGGNNAGNSKFKLANSSTTFFDTQLANPTGSNVYLDSTIPIPNSTKESYYLIHTISSWYGNTSASKFYYLFFE